MKASNASSAAALVSAIQISCNARLVFGCWLFGNLASTLAVLCTQQRCSRVFGQTSPPAEVRRGNRKPGSRQHRQLPERHLELQRALLQKRVHPRQVPTESFHQGGERRPEPQPIGLNRAENSDIQNEMADHPVAFASLI